MEFSPIKVLAVSSYPNEAAATRFRIAQFIEPLREYGIEVELRPFLDSDGFKSFYRDGDGFEKVLKAIAGIAERAGDVVTSGKYDVLFVQREAMFFGPEIFEFLVDAVKRIPMVLDLDDATYVRYTSPRFGKIGSLLKFFGKTDRLIDRAETVVCGNRFIAEYAESRGARTVEVPTIVDLDVFKPLERREGPPVIGWIGTHSTFPSVRSVFPVLERLSAEFDFKVKIVGAGSNEVSIPGAQIENLGWDLDREVEDFRSLDIGLYPVKISSSANEEWLKGKSGFKAIQYMATGTPFVMSPVGICAELGIPGETHFNAVTDEDWYNSLKSLLSDENRRRQMGESARSYSQQHFSLPRHVEVLADTIRNSVRKH
ncbi:MAG: glycosyltransferase [Acidobacteria bacterium]|nr:MAG: glycosyltransferase [Acidobacteriota bacterium]REJ99074.1 MAG: glycosyltransferase [Acidobacteriota bacterium]REK16206.1 MAG: glycosyltransferase [Acidobacteriota bacterium]REK43887.1 MAG: glycosyltransferase [Acidobacteriota bacterium]